MSMNLSKLIDLMPDDKRFHISPTEIERVRLVEQKNVPYDGFKPKGFWYDFGGNWIECMRDNSPKWITPLRFIYEVSVANVLAIRTLEELDAFEQAFLMGRFEGIDWQKVGSRYQGIEITPYQWHRRLSSLWYYTWDCASGCVWSGKVEVNLFAVKSKNQWHLAERE